MLKSLFNPEVWAFSLRIDLLSNLQRLYIERNEPAKMDITFSIVWFDGIKLLKLSQIIFLYVLKQWQNSEQVCLT